MWGLGGTNGVFGLIDDGSMLPTVAIPAADSYALMAGVLGAANTSTGVAGMGNGVGVFGQNGNAPGLSTGRRCGVLGASLSATGVVGKSSTGTGVLGSTGGSAPMRPGLVAGVIGTGRQDIGVCWEPRAERTNAPDTVAGVVGTESRGVNGVGLSPELASAGVDGDRGVAIAGFANGPNGRAVFGQALAAGAKAGDFRGNVDISRALTVQGQVLAPGAKVALFRGDVEITRALTVGGTLTATVKNAIVPFPDGTTRLMHCMESPEHWFEDFGTARLKQGRAVVKLDADFAKTIKARDYRVFLTPEGDCGGLYIRNRRSASFEVRELQGGASSVTFSYRIVGRRKDIRKHRRFDKFAIEPPGRPQPSRARPWTRCLPKCGSRPERRPSAPAGARRRAVRNACPRCSPGCANKPAQMPRATASERSARNGAHLSRGDAGGGTPRYNQIYFDRRRGDATLLDGVGILTLSRRRTRMSARLATMR